jgi:hypothetical protein
MKKTFCELLFLGLGVVAFRKSGRRLFRETHSQSVDSQELTSALATRRYMMYVLLPVWFVPGVLDWIWHRQTKIETTSGVKESLIHSLMMTEVGLPILMGLFLEINAGVFAAMLGAAALHEATAFWDVGFAVSRRKILPREQHTHSLLEVLPLAAVSFAACLHPEQFLSLFGAGPESPRMEIRWKRPALPKPYIAGILGAIALFIAAPYAEENIRCWKASRKGLAGKDTPKCARILFGKER